ncbi:hypothetical protein D3C71_494040 [compost metagenome]
MQTGGLERAFDLFRADQLFILMRAAGQPAQDIFGGEDRECAGLQRAVDRRHEHQAAGAHHGGAGGEEQVHIGNMFDDFHVEDDVECFSRLGKILGGDGTVIDLRAGFLRVGRGDADILLRRVGSYDGCAHAGNRFGQKAATAADIEDAQTFQGAMRLRVTAEILADAFADIGKANRIELVQRTEFSGGAPPFGSHFREHLDLILVDRRSGCFRHRLIILRVCVLKSDVETMKSRG